MCSVTIQVSLDTTRTSQPHSDMYTVLAFPGSLRGSKEVTTSIYQGRDTRVEEG